MFTHAMELELSSNSDMGLSSGPVMLDPEPSRDARNYAWNIRAQAESGLHETLYPAKVFEDLADFLEQDATPPRRRKASIHEHPEQISHAILHTLSRSSGGRQRQVFTDAQSCVDAISSADEISDESSQTPQVLFLRGYSLPEWLLKIAGTCNTNPEFLNSNMLFRCRKTYFSYPSLPSSHEDIIRLRVSTIGMRADASDSRPNAEVIRKLRLQSEEHMDEYLDNLRSGFNIRLCDSIVREFHIMNEQFFVVEQEISVCLHTFSNRWFAWVCQDSGKSLAEGVEGPWLSKAERDSAGIRATRFHPIIQHGNRDWLRRNTVMGGEQTQAHCRYPQTAALLPLAFGDSLNREIMAYDPLYALTEVFRLSASSESQFLRLLERTIVRDTDYKSLQEKEPTLTNLVYCREILSKHSERMRELVQWIRRYRRRHPLHVSVEDENLQREAENVTDALLTDFEHLIGRADLLSKRCNTGMTVIGNNAMLDESRKAIFQARRVARLTFIAFVFVPLSFTTSLFGMNVSQLGTGDTSIGIWAGVSSAVLFITTLMFFVDGITIANTSARMHLIVARMHRSSRRLQDDSAA